MSQDDDGAGDGQVLAPHPITGALFPSPVPPGTGWPGDTADAGTPVAATAAQVRRQAREALSTSVPEAGTDGHDARFDALDARIGVCRACPRLVRWREEVAATKRRAFADEPYWGRPVPGFGDRRAPIVIVGLAPAAHGANRTGRMFTGDRSGDWLFAALHRAGLADRPASAAAGDGLTLTGARIVSAVRCAPPANKPTVTERDRCAPWLHAELDLLAVHVRVLLALGGFGWDAALRAATGAGWTVPRPKPRFGHGARAVLIRPGAAPVMLLGCFHPSQQNTFTGRLTAEMIDQVLAEARALAAGD